jgi:type II secretory pathway component PulJ
MKRLYSTKGLSIVEMVIALAILGLVSIGIMGFFTDSFKFQGRSQSLVVAQKEVEAIMEVLKNNNGSYKTIDITEYSNNSENKVDNIIIGNLFIIQSN